MARRLIHNHGEAAVREVLLAMAWQPDFEPSAYLWNADHWDVACMSFFVARVVRFQSARVHD